MRYSAFIAAAVLAQDWDVEPGLGHGRPTVVSPQVVSTAIVQINDYGEYVVNSWEVSIA